MAVTNTIKNICRALGENNKPTYVVMAIAAVKGICRPAFTMMDKKETPETKKYTALREGLTEAIAMPVYWACGEIAAKFGETVTSKWLDKKFEKELKKGHTYTDKVKNEMRTELIKKGKSGLMFIGVCTAALFVIPGVCSLVIKPIMNLTGLKAPQDKENKKLDITEGLKNELPKQSVKQIYNNPQITRPGISDFYKTYPWGMKAGGI